MASTSDKAALAGLHVAVLLFGLAGIFAKIMTAAPLVIVVGRTFFATLALGGAMVLLPHDRPAVRPKTLWLPPAALGVVLALHWWSFFQAIRLSTVATGLLGYAAFPLFITIAEPLLFKERFRRFDALTATAIVIGLAAVAWPFDLKAARAWGLIWGIFSGWLFALLSLGNRRWVTRYGPLRVACVQNGVAFLVLLPALYWCSWRPTWRETALLLFLGVVCTAGAHVLFIGSLIRVRTQLAGVVAALEPVYGIILAFWLIGEKPAWGALFGGVVIVGTSCLAMRYRAPHRDARPTALSVPDDRRG